MEPASEAPDKMESDSLELLNSHPEVKFVDGEKAGMGETVEVEDAESEVMNDPEQYAAVEDALIPARVRVRICCIRACKRC